MVGIFRRKWDALKAAYKSPERGDQYIWGIFIALCVVSFIETYSASSREVDIHGIFNPIIKHGAMLLMGWGVVYVIQLFSYEKYLKSIFLFIIASFLLVIYVSLAGDVINGARRSIGLFGFTLQPSEFAKLSIVMLISWVLSRTQTGGTISNRGIYISAICVILFGALLFKQGLTNTLLLMCISLSMMLIGGVPWRKFGLVILVYAVIALAALSFMSLMNDEPADVSSSSATVEVSANVDGANEPNRRSTWSKRFERYFAAEPLYTQEVNSINQQEMFSYMAQANGGAFGTFPGNSRECSRLPLAFSDYVFSIIVEEVGFVGGMLLLALYLCLLARAGIIAHKCRKAFPALLVMGMAVFITFQALFHMAINVGVFPVSGQPLPLISMGGTSILVTSIAFGFMLSVSKYAQTTGRVNKRADAGLPNELTAVNPLQIK